jgi:hypothetical protein
MTPTTTVADIAADGTAAASTPESTGQHRGINRDR